MTTFGRMRLQLEPPGAIAQPPGALAIDPPHDGAKKNPMVHMISPPVLARRKLARPPPAPASTFGEALSCAPGCLRGDDHVGCCLTTDGLAPPNVKRRHCHCKRTERKVPDEPPTPPKRVRDE